MSKKVFRALGIIIMVFSVLISMSLPAYADEENGKTVWDGSFKLKSGQEYYVNKRIELQDDYSVPKDAILHIEDGGQIIVSKEHSLTVRGTVRVHRGGVLRTYGQLLSTDTSSFIVIGTIVIRDCGSFGLKGDMLIYSSGYLNCLGEFNMGSAASIGCYGNFYARENADVKLGGTVAIKRSGYLRAYCNVAVKSDASVNIKGEFALRNNSEINLMGNMKLEKDGIMSGNGKLLCDDASSLENLGSIDSDIYSEKPEFELIQKDGIWYVGDTLIVNKKYALPSDYAPGVNSTAQKALDKLFAAANNVGFSPTVLSSYRAYSYQKQVYSYWVKLYGEAYASMISAVAGTSEHQSGLAFDISSLLTSYGNTAEGIWLKDNCADYGFIIRYPSDKVDITGYYYEPWHIRYVGTELAKAITESGLCLEEYFGIE